MLPARPLPEEGAALAKKTDAVTRWWRGTSLRAKVTGVTLALLVIGLFAAGIGTLAFLRNTLIINLDAQLEALAPTDVASGLIDIEVVGGQATFSEKPDAPNTQYFVAIYDSAGELRASAGGDRSSHRRRIFDRCVPAGRSHSGDGHPERSR